MASLKWTLLSMIAAARRSTVALLALKLSSSGGSALTMVACYRQSRQSEAGRTLAESATIALSAASSSRYCVSMRVCGQVGAGGGARALSGG